MVSWLGLNDWLRRNGVRTRAPLARVGVQFGARQVRIARVAPHAGEAPRVEFAELIAAEPARRADALRWAAQAGAFRYAYLTLVLSAGEYDVHHMPLPAAPAEELREAVRWQLRGVLPYPPDEAAVDFVRLPQPTDLAKAPVALAVAARTTHLRALARAFEEAGLQPDAIDIPEFAQRNVGASLPHGEGSQAWLSFEGDSCLLTVQLGDELAFSRRIQLPALRAASDVIDLDAEAARPSVDERIANQVQRSLDLFERQSGLPPVLQTHVAPHPQAAPIARALADRTGIETAVFDPREAYGFSSSARADRADVIAECFYALGAALRLDARPAAMSQRGSPRIARWFHKLGQAA